MKLSTLTLTLALFVSSHKPLIGRESGVIGGRVADAKAYPAVVYASMGRSRCTATVVGSQALLIAAHCVRDSKTATFRVNGKLYGADCDWSPNYPQDPTSDWALCAISEPVHGIEYEVLSQSLDDVKVGDTVLLTGYGCIRAGGGGGNDGIYRIGEAVVERVPSETNNDIVTSKGAALCFGDSGGPAFKVKGNERRVLSVNSRGNIRTTSYLVSLSTAKAKAFIEEWMKETGLKICGVSSDAKGCRP